MKKVRIRVGLVFVLAIALLFSSSYCVLSTNENAEVAETAAVALNVSGKASVLLSASDGKVLHENNKDEKLPIASISKVMTMLLTVEAIEDGHLKLDDMLTTSAHAESRGGSQIWLKTNETMSVRDLFKAVAVVSANDASVVLAEAISGTEEVFVGKMNEKAAKLGMQNTHFKDCNGLDDEGYSSAYDVALMARELMEHEMVTEFTTIWMDTLRDGKSELVNTNRLIRFYEGATGLKTGTTTASGSCLVATATREDVSFIAVTLGCSTSEERFESARKMLDYGFSNFEIYQPAISADEMKKVRVKHGIESFVETEIVNTENITIGKGSAGDLRYEYSFVENAEAPVTKGQVLGSLKLYFEEEVIVEYPILAKVDVGRMKFGSALYILFSYFVS